MTRHPVAAPSVTSLRVTIAEDDDATAYTLAKDLRTLGCTPLHVATTVQELIERARLDRPDLLLADVRLGDGTESRPGDGLPRATLPIVLVSAYTDEDVRRR